MQEGEVAPYLFAVLIGVVAGRRAMIAPATVSWTAHPGRLDLDGTWLAAAFGSDRPAAFTEDAVVLGGALLIALAR